MHTQSYLEQFSSESPNPNEQPYEDFLYALFELKADDEDAFFNHINQFTEADKKLAFEYYDVCLAFDYNAEPELESKLEFLNLFKV